MELTAAASWLMEAFYTFDYAILRFLHTLAESAGVIMTPFMKLVSLTGYEGYFLIFMACFLMLFKKTRKLGLCAFLAMAIGAVFTNLTIKTTVARPRPYDYLEEYHTWWLYTNGVLESEIYSFPSGHTTAATAFSASLVLVKGKKWLPWAVLYVLLMGMSRNYLVVHYPSDILGGIIVGTCAALAAWLIVSAVYKRFGDKLDSLSLKRKETISK